MAKVLADHADWVSWLNENIRRGCDRTVLLATLVKNDFDEASIRAVLDGLQANVSGGLPAAPGTSSFQSGQVPTEKLQLYILPDFLSAQACQNIIAVGSDRLRDSTVSLPGQNQGGYVDPGYRTSQTCDLSLLDNEWVKAVDDKICAAMGIPAQLSEGTQLQRYDVGQQFRRHTDYFAPGTGEYAAFCAERGNRTWTVMIYLNDVQKGGGTHFFAIDRTIMPRRGTALVWNNRYADGRVNPDTLHAGLPVEEGCKVIITKWFRER